MSKVSDITVETLLADGWVKGEDPMYAFKKEIENINPLNASEDTDIHLVCHGLYNSWTFAISLPDGGLLNFSPGSMTELQAFEKMISFYDAPF